MAEIRSGIRKSKKRRRRIIRKLIPMLVALVLVSIVVLVAFATGLFEQLFYSNTIADYNEYFKLENENEAAILVGNEYLQDKAVVQNGKFYISADVVKAYFWDDFYFDEREGCLLYTGADSTEVMTADTGAFIFSKDQLYLNADYVQQYANIEVEVWTEPAHVEIKYKRDNIRVADATRNTKARVQGGIKSDVLTEVNEGSTVEIIEPMETWCKVKTADGFIGYIENKCLSEYREEESKEIAAPKALNITHTLRNHKIALGWHQVTNMTANGLITSAIENTKGLNVISPTWFTLSDNEGNIASIASSDYVNTAHAAGLEVWAVIDNFGEGIDSYEVLSYTGKRQLLINNLMQEVLGKGIDGINIDFETLDASCAGCFPQFIRELSIPCRQNGIVLSVDNYVPKEYTEFYNRAAQGRYADYVIIMGYDEHYAGSAESGSVASFDFVREGIEKTLEDVPASQVINGIPFYTRSWEEGAQITSNALSMSQAQEFVRNHGIELGWNDQCAQNYGETVENGVTYRIWMEDAQSLQVKLNLMQNNNIAGVACWKLGLETDDVWDLIAAYMNN